MDAVILAAGEGTRLRPLTSTRPKPMLQVAGKPILEWDIEALTRIGIFNKIILVTGYRSEKIKDYFGDEFNNIKIQYIEQKEQLGTAHAISVVSEHVNGDFLVMNGDLLISNELIDDLIKNHKNHNPSASLSLIKVDNPSHFGVVELKNDKVISIEEKPRYPRSNLANAGIYIFSTEIFDALKKVEKSIRAEYEITDAIDMLIHDGKNDKNMVHGFECKGLWMDIGRPWNLLDANEILLKRDNFIKPEIHDDAVIEQYTTIKGKVHIGSGTVIKSGAYVEGPCYIGNNCNIGPNCYIRAGTTLGDNVTIGNAVEIKNTIIMANTHVGHLSYVGDSLIGNGCNFGAGTKVANLRFDDGEIKVRVNDKFEGSGRRKFGTIFGDDVKTGINVSIMPGVSIYPDARVEAGSVVRNTIFSKKI
ncbi:MAG: glucose-1-phosphate thymidylyltransferase [Candidatus Altiarchaeales archaeon HGW-Altiarchaeales-3]|nr:MAG: glucose-1-phosphate thymidylyltransferase [Candidatus Altiarchaeales archaeon HGW-Altiarchaeales-3]